MRKLLGIVLALLIAVMPACFAEEQEPEQKLLNQWLDVLAVYESDFQEKLWAVSYAETFVLEPTWENLQYARMAVNAAGLYSQLRPAPVHTLTDADYAFFMDRGADVEVIAVEIDNYAANKALLPNQCLLLEESITHDVFWKFGLDALSEELKIDRQIVEKEARYYGCTTAYILLQLNGSQWTEKFLALIDEYMPMIAGYTREYLNMDAEQLMNTAGELLDTVDQLESDGNVLSGVREASKNNYLDALEKGDLVFFEENRVEIEGLPLLLPDTGWELMGAWEIRYFWRDAEGKADIPEPLCAIDRVPDGYNIICENVPREDVLAYAQGLEQSYGISCTSQTEENGVLKLFYILPETSFVISWENGTVQFFAADGQVCFAPYAYVRLS